MNLINKIVLTGTRINNAFIKASPSNQFLLGFYIPPIPVTTFFSIKSIYDEFIRVSTNRGDKMLALTLTPPIALMNGMLWPIYWTSILLDKTEKS